MSQQEELEKLHSKRVELEAASRLLKEEQDELEKKLDKAKARLTDDRSQESTAGQAIRPAAKLAAAAKARQGAA